MKARFSSETLAIIVSMVLLMIIGILALWSVSPRPDGHDNEPILSKSYIYSQVFSYQPVKQGLFAVIGLLLFILINRWTYYSFKSYSYAFYAILILSLIALEFVGRMSQGSRRWAFIGPFALQPSEFMKIATVMVLSAYLMHKANIKSFFGLIIPYALVVLPMGLILLQPDLGTALVFLPILFSMVFVAGARVKLLIITILVCVALIPVGYFWVLKDYQKVRLQVFLNPSKSPTADAYHLMQSRIAVGSGGLTGQIFKDDAQTPTVFVPARHTDFIFTVIAEKWGFLGVSVVLLLYFIIFASSLFIAATTREPFGRLLIVGITAYLVTQVIVNISMTVGMAPITGITLPLMSYGGSSLWSTLIALALIVNVRLKQIPTFSSRDFE